MHDFPHRCTAVSIRHISQYVSVAVPRAGAEIVILAGGETTMRRCRPGFAKSQPGGYRCVRCTPGSYASSTGSLHCRVCPYGTTSNSARTGCGEPPDPGMLPMALPTGCHKTPAKQAAQVTRSLTCGHCRRLVAVKLRCTWWVAGLTWVLTAIRSMCSAVSDTEAGHSADVPAHSGAGSSTRDDAEPSFPGPATAAAAVAQPSRTAIAKPSPEPPAAVAPAAVPSAALARASDAAAAFLCGKPT